MARKKVQGRKRASGAGRPLRGDQKRVRVSFTLHPRHVKWLREVANARDTSRSELLDDVFDSIQEHWEQGESVLKSRSRIQVSLPAKKLEDFCRRHHILKLSLYGSVLTDAFGPESDIDVLVEFEADHTPSLFEMIPMETELSQLFGDRKVDLRTSQELSPYFRDEVIQNSEALYVS